jgi:L-lactate dehydrogenase
MGGKQDGNKVAIIGAGSVGSTSAYACLLLKAASTVVMVDVDQARVESEVADLADAAFITDSKVKVGSLQEAGQCDVIVVTAGAKQRPGESRIDLIARNHKILSSVIDGMKPIKPSAVMLLVANPVDVLTQVCQQISDLPRNQILGSGTFLDTQRLRLELSKVLNIAESSIHAYILGGRSFARILTIY